MTIKDKLEGAKGRNFEERQLAVCTLWSKMDKASRQMEDFEEEALRTRSSDEVHTMLKNTSNFLAYM